MRVPSVKIVSFLKSHILGIILVGIFCSLVASFIYSWIQSRPALTKSSPNPPTASPFFPSLTPGSAAKVPPRPPVHSVPLPADITAEIGSRPPFQQDEAARYYFGQRFRWPVTLKSARTSDRAVHVMFLDRGNYPWVFCEFPITEYRFLQTAKEGTEFYITGTILKADSGKIELTDATLE